MPGATYHQANNARSSIHSNASTAETMDSRTRIMREISAHNFALGFFSDSVDNMMGSVSDNNSGLGFLSDNTSSLTPIPEAKHAIKRQNATNLSECSTIDNSQTIDKFKCQFANRLEPKCDRLNDAALEKKMKKVIKEGGKKGVEIEGAADVGGLQFFITAVIEPEADLDMLVETMRAMNATSDPTEEERQGGSGKVGKTIFTCTDDALCVVAYVPEEHAEKCNAKEWLTNTVTEIVRGGNDRVGDAKAMAESLVMSCEGKEKNFAKAKIARDGDKALFPLKMKDACINHGYAYLKGRGLFPDGDDSDDDEMVFGDEDMDGCEW